MGPILFCLAAGTLLILVRRPFAREIKRSRESFRDVAYDEDGLAWWLAAMGGLIILFGLVFLALWLFHA